LQLVTQPHARALERYVAQGSLSSLAAFPPRRALGGAAQENSNYLACGAEKARAAGRAAGPERGPCATRLRGILLEYFTHRLRSCENIETGHSSRTIIQQLTLWKTARQSIFSQLLAQWATTFRPLCGLYCWTGNDG